MHEAQKLGIASMDDFNKQFPGRVDEIREWFRIYKTLDGKPENKFTEDGRVYTAAQTMEIVPSTVEQYRKLMDPVYGLPEREDFWLETNEDKL